MSNGPCSKDGGKNKLSHNIKYMSDEEDDAVVVQETTNTIVGLPPPWRHTFFNEMGIYQGVPFAWRQAEPIFGDQLDDILRLWKEDEKMTFPKFFEVYDDLACSDWGKSDMCDGPKYSKDDYGRIGWHRIYQSRRMAGAIALAALPYPPRVVLYAMEHLCAFRCERVETVEDLCEWVIAQQAQLGLISGRTEPIVPDEDFFNETNPAPLSE